MPDYHLLEMDSDPRNSLFTCCGKGKGCPAACQTGTMGGRGTDLPILDPGARMAVGQRHALAALPGGKRPGALLIPNPVISCLTITDHNYLYNNSNSSPTQKNWHNKPHTVYRPTARLRS